LVFGAVDHEAFGMLYSFVTVGQVVREVAQIGAAIGREFSHALLGAVVRKPNAELASALDRLIAAGLLFRQGVPPHATYLFKHALVQDAAYSTLLREPRRALHTLIGYVDQPTAMQLIVYAATLAIIAVLMKVFAVPHQGRPRAA
jgi:hypothetical protein